MARMDKGVVRGGGRVGNVTEVTSGMCYCQYTREPLKQ